MRSGAVSIRINTGGYPIGWPPDHLRLNVALAALRPAEVMPAEADAADALASCCNGGVGDGRADGADRQLADFRVVGVAGQPVEVDIDHRRVGNLIPADCLSISPGHARLEGRIGMDGADDGVGGPIRERETHRCAELLRARLFRLMA
jgi:hypothetical protein